MDNSGRLLIGNTDYNNANTGVLINGATHNKKLNGIHRIYGFPEGVDSAGKSFADTMVYIEEFIDEFDNLIKQ